MARDVRSMNRSPPYDSKWPWYTLVGVYWTMERAFLPTQKNAQWIARAVFQKLIKFNVNHVLMFWNHASLKTKLELKIQMQSGQLKKNKIPSTLDTWWTSIMGGWTPIEKKHHESGKKLTIRFPWGSSVFHHSYVQGLYNTYHPPSASMVWAVDGSSAPLAPPKDYFTFGIPNREDRLPATLLQVSCYSWLFQQKYHDIPTGSFRMPIPTFPKSTKKTTRDPKIHALVADRKCSANCQLPPFSQAEIAALQPELSCCAWRRMHINI